MNDGPHMPEPGTVAVGVGVLSLVATGLTLLFRTAFRVGVEARTSERIATDLSEIKTQISALAGGAVAQNLAIVTEIAALKVELATVKGRIAVLENTRPSRPHIGE